MQRKKRVEKDEGKKNDEVEQNDVKLYNQKCALEKSQGRSFSFVTEVTDEEN